MKKGTFFIVTIWFDFLKIIFWFTYIFLLTPIEHGNTIKAKILRDLDDSTEIPLEEGHCYEIKNSY